MEDGPFERQGQGLADLHGGRGQGSEGDSLAGLLMSGAARWVVCSQAMHTVGLSIITESSNPHPLIQFRK